MYSATWLPEAPIGSSVSPPCGWFFSQALTSSAAFSSSASTAAATASLDSTTPGVFANASGAAVKPSRWSQKAAATAHRAAKPVGQKQPRREEASRTGSGVRR